MAHTIKMVQANRILWVDIAKTLGIFLVVLGHFHVDSRYVAGYIFMFHMPLFFFISGYLMSAKRLDMNMTAPSEFVAGRINRLIVPFYLFQVIGLIILIIRLLIGGGNAGDVNWQEYAAGSLLGTPGHMLDVPAWFLLSLFLCNIILYACFNFKILRYMVVPAIVAAIFVKLPAYFAIHTVPVSFLYFASGFAVKQYIDKLTVIISRNIAPALACSFALMIALMWIYLEIGNLDIGKGEYTSYPAISIASAFLGIAGIFGISAVMQSVMQRNKENPKIKSIFVKCSDATIIILGLHIFAVEMLQLHLPKLFGHVPVAVAASLLITGILAAIYPRLSSYFPLLCGKPIMNKSKRIA
ncbi:MAG: acyltransferase family protein [Lachnospiraceae bacterium]|nr:acyltransferase family protein [Lachnospiraceae bacterium]